MLVLGIESASDQCGCALAGADGVVAEARLALPRRHAEALAPQIRFVCEQAGVALGDVEAVAVDHGPGLYTGLRAGLATAKATAAALGIGVVPVISLEALAFGAAARIDIDDGVVIVSMIDARRGEVFWAAYRVYHSPPAGRDSPADSGGLARSDVGVNSRLIQEVAPRVSLPSEIFDGLTSPVDLTAGYLVHVGNGADHWSRPPLAEVRYPEPSSVALLGRERALAGEAVPPDQVDALYFRSPDAKPQPQP